MNTEILSQKHLDQLHASAISDEVIRARGYRTVTDANDLEALGFAPGQRRVPGLLLPLWTTAGKNGLYQYKPDNPRVNEDKSKKNPDGTHPCRVIKYETPKGAGIRLDCPPSSQKKLGDPSIPLWLTEGTKKADSLASHGLLAIALMGVWGFRGKNEFGAPTFLADWDYIALKGREVRIVFDSDVMTKGGVKQALDRLTAHLQNLGATVSPVYLPNDPQAGKMGVDDWLAMNHTVQELENLVTAPRPAPKAAPELVELLDNAPARMTRPLCLIDGKAYAAAWLPVRVTKKETTTSKGEIVRHDPPLVASETRLFLIRNDGVVFGDGGNQPLSALGLEVHLPEIPMPGKTWTTRGVKAYASGERPDPVDVFGRVKDVVNHFIDFDRSLAPQDTMAEAVACFSLSTWLLDAFNVAPYLWPNGDKGSGKTNLLSVICDTSYLGQLIQASGSFAALRDMADYGACLAFDDAEKLNDPKSDPDKRALLLAGNRRGVVIPLKEMSGDKTWKTRYVSTFCARMFSAISLPDEVLGSRSIVVPLVRTADRTRGNAEPADHGSWPCDYRQLVDDLWALGLAYLPELSTFDNQVGEQCDLQGRALQPWRAILAVALWLESKGMTGLAGRMEALSVSYQKERTTLTYSDITILVIRAMMECAAREVSEVSGVSEVNKEVGLFIFLTSSITAEAVKIAEADELDIDTERLTSRRVGRVIGKMRLEKSRKGGKGTAQWIMSRNDLERLAISYNLAAPEALKKCEVNEGIGEPLPINLTNSTNLTNLTRGSGVSPSEAEINARLAAAEMEDGAGG